MSTKSTQVNVDLTDFANKLAKKEIKKLRNKIHTIEKQLSNKDKNIIDLHEKLNLIREIKQDYKEDLSSLARDVKSISSTITGQIRNINRITGLISVGDLEDLGYDLQDTICSLGTFIKDAKKWAQTIGVLETSSNKKSKKS